MKLLALEGMALALAACGGGAETLDDGGTSTGCPLEAAPGVRRALVVDGGCVYNCTPLPNGGQVQAICSGDNACHPLNTVANCGECGRSCGGATPYCVTQGVQSYCSARPTP